ncbi:MAG: Na(+)/H(+) antiporter subunit D [Burkholderiaceae bacterium]
MHPGLILLFTGLFTILIPFKFARYIWFFSSVISLYLSVTLDFGSSLTFNYLNFEIVLLRVDGLSKVFAIIFSLMTLIGLIFAWNQKSKSELLSVLIYSGAAIGAVLAGDVFSLFFFWELMAIGSTLIIFSANTRFSSKAGFRYALIHFAGGVVLMAGLTGYVAETNSVVFENFTLESPFSWMILAGFLVNAGAPPFSSWLPDAYPEASFSGSVFLSAFTTKTAVYTLLRGFPGNEILIAFGLFMIFYGIIYALLENDMRRILSYSIINQVGFMVVGAGIGTEMAINGASAHAFAHILYKALLLMSAGSVFLMTGKRKCSELGGLFQTMPLTMICGTIGAFAISAFPLTSGFVTKSMISQAVADQHLFVVWLLLAAASAGVFLHAGIKFPWFVFFQKDSGLRPPEPPINMRLAMIILSLLCIGIGVFPGYLYSILPYAVNYIPYTASHVVFQLQLLLFAGFAFFVMLPWLKRTLTISLDTDWFYRRFFPSIISNLNSKKFIFTKSSPIKSIHKINDGMRISKVLIKNYSSGEMVLWVTIILALYLFIFYLIK